MSMTREQRIARSEEIFAHVWGENGVRRESWSTLDDCVSDLYGWAEEVEADAGPYRTSNAKIANELRKVAERLQSIDLEEGAA